MRSNRLRKLKVPDYRRRVSLHSKRNSVLEYRKYVIVVEFFQLLKSQSLLKNNE